MSENNEVEIDDEKKGRYSRYFTQRDWDNWIEVGSAILMSLAIIASAWCAYQAARWSGVQSIEFSQAAADRNKSVEFANMAGNEEVIDATLFQDYAMMYLEGNVSQEQLDHFAERMFTDRLEIAVEAWLETDPLNNPDAPKNPFNMEEYNISDLIIADAFYNMADMDAEEARAANQQADNYVMLTVLFAAVLFFGGVATKLKIRWIKIIILIAGFLIFYATTLTLTFQSIH